MRDVVEHRRGWEANLFFRALFALDDRVGENKEYDEPTGQPPP